MAKYASERTNVGRRFDPPPPTGVPDALTQAARQVRIDATRNDLPVHTVAADWVDPWDGMVYRTLCAKVLAKVEGAILTTRATTCTRCLVGGS